MNPDEKIIRTDFGFECRYYPTIMDGIVLRWTNGYIEINCSRNGVGIDTCGRVPVEATISVIRLAEKIYYQLRGRKELAELDFGSAEKE